MKESLRIHGRLIMEVFENGHRVLWHVQDNLITDVGLNMLRDMIGRDAPGTGAGFRPSYIALGTGTTTPAVSDTILDTEVFRNILTARKGVDKTFIGQLHLTTSEANGYTIYEAGLFDSSSEGNMLCRTLLTIPLVKTASVEATFTWNIEIDRG